MATETMPCRLMRSSEMMKILGCSRTKVYLLTMQKKNPLPSIKVGGSRRYPLDKVQSWLSDLSPKAPGK